MITALILALIIEPAQPLQHLALLGWAAVWAMGAKYLLAVRKKHLFNPAAFGVVVTSLVLGQSASWWVGAPRCCRSSSWGDCCSSASSTGSTCCGPSS